MGTELKIVERLGEIMVLLPREIDHHAAKEIREKIDELIISAEPVRLVLDFFLVDFMDSSGIGLIIGRSEIAAGYGGDVVIVNSKPHIRRLFVMSGIQKIKNLYIKDYKGTVLR